MTSFRIDFLMNNHIMVMGMLCKLFSAMYVVEWGNIGNILSNAYSKGRHLRPTGPFKNL